MSTPAADMDAALEQMRTALAAAVPAGVSVTRAGGAFDAAEIRRHVTQAPAVVLACLGLRDFARRAAYWGVTAQLAVYIITRDAPPDTARDRHALALASTLVSAISRATWGDAVTFGVPDEGSIDAANLYSGAIDADAVALWAVTWRQRATLQFPPED